MSKEDRNYIIYLEERLRQVDDRMTSLEAALQFALIQLNKCRMDHDMAISRQNVTIGQCTQLYNLLNEKQPLSADTLKKFKKYYQ